jgi:hypothetical protein
LYKKAGQDIPKWNLLISESWIKNCVN